MHFRVIYTRFSCGRSHACRMGESNEIQFYDGYASAHALTYGTLRATRTLELDIQSLQSILDTDAAVVKQLLGNQALIDPATPQGKRALRLVRLNRALGDVFGSAERVQRFLASPIPEFGDTARNLLATCDGVERVLAIVERDVRDSLDPGFSGALQSESAT